MEHTQPTIILDRDGVINIDSDEFIKSPDELQAIPGSLQAITRLTQAGFRIFIATNQSGVARGLFDTKALQAIHTKMLAQITAAGGHIEGIAICPHGPEDGCSCRKPKPGLFLQLAQTYNINLLQTYSVGDAWRDIEAACAAGCLPILVKTGKGATTLAAHAQELVNIPIVADLNSAVTLILTSKEQ